jgi:tetratricopeptide (TPR) repeat protein
MDDAPLMPEASTSSVALEPNRSSRSARLDIKARARSLGRMAMGGALLAALLGLTYWHAVGSSSLDRSREAEQKLDFVTALRLGREHLASRPWSREADRIAARCFSRLDFSQEAEPYYRAAGTLDLEDLHYRAYGIARANQRDRALEIYEEILKRKPDDASALSMAAAVLITQSRWDAVKGMARRLVDARAARATVYKPIVAGTGHWTLRPTEVASVPAMGFTLLAMVHHDLREHEAAVAAFEHVLELDPALRSAPVAPSVFWADFAQDLTLAGRSMDTIRYLTRATGELAEPALFDLLGQAYLQQSQFDDAETSWRQALEINPNHFPSLLNLGRLELKRTRPEAAMKSLNHAARIAPESYELVYAMSLAQHQLGNEKEARRYAEKADRLRRQTDKGPRELRKPTPG